MIKRWKVLVVEDEDTIRTLLSDLLTDEGYEVLEARNGYEALDLLKYEIPDIILLDCEMPKMDGYETIKRIRENTYWVNIPVIFLTVRSSEQDQVRGIELGAEDYIVKPFNKNILLAKIKILLKRKELTTNINPLTKLPGNLLIQEEIEKRLLRDSDFVLLYIDLNNFKAYNDYYGFARGDEVIKFTAEIIKDVESLYGEKEDLIGHIGGDDFVVITSSKNYQIIAEEIIKNFDKEIKKFYDAKDLERGYITTQNREGKTQDFPIMTISIVAVSSAKTRIVDYYDLSQKAASLKKYAKQMGKSVFLEERRKE